MGQQESRHEQRLFRDILSLALQVFPDLKIIISLREPIRHVCRGLCLQLAVRAYCKLQPLLHVYVKAAATCVSRQRHGTGTTTGRCIPADAPEPHPSLPACLPACSRALSMQAHMADVHEEGCLAG